MLFFIDAQLSPKLKLFFINHGHEAQHVFDTGIRQLADSAIWDIALQTSAIIVTKDEDFALRRMVVSNGPNVVWIRRGNCTHAAMIDWLTPLWPLLLDRLLNGDTLIEMI